MMNCHSNQNTRTSRARVISNVNDFIRFHDGELVNGNGKTVYYIPV